MQLVGILDLKLAMENNFVMENTTKCDNKIGLVPLLYEEYNYGGVLQLYALQHAIKKLGYEVNIIKFNNDERIREIRDSFIKRAVIKSKGLTYKLFHRNYEQEIEKAVSERKRKIDVFKSTYYSKSLNEKDVDLYEYSSFVCGSDQIWNPNWARRRCFLEFVPDNINKVIYAASLGVEELEECDKVDFKKRIERLEFVSVREYSAKSILENITNRRDIEIVVDPTLLLLPEEWTDVCENISYEGKSYILTYFLGDYSTIKGFVEDFARNKGLPIINIPFASADKMDNENFGDRKVINASPGEFLSLIRNARYVFTDSFHACVFSILFKTQYYAFERDGKTSMLDRILTLQKNFNIPNRIIPVMEIKEQNDIDFSNNDNNQTRLRNQSLNYLTESLRNEQ